LVSINQLNLVKNKNSGNKRKRGEGGGENGIFQGLPIILKLEKEKQPINGETETHLYTAQRLSVSRTTKKCNVLDVRLENYVNSVKKASC
jgi:hypothetical protein